jgi:hypothetical protein
MKTLTTAMAKKSNKVRFAAAFLAAGVVGGWTLSHCVPHAAAFEASSLLRIAQKSEKPLVDDVKVNLAGSYAVTGTDTDGKAYAEGGIVDLTLAASGSIEVSWDNGRQVGVGQVIGNTLMVSYLVEDRTAILVMHINPDGTLAGTWSRRTDRGHRGTEMWQKI